MSTTTIDTNELANHPVVSESDWIAASAEFLAKEKEFTKLRDELNRKRRALPWTKVEKNYIFEGPDGPQSLSDLFEGKSQLLVYHQMYGPDWQEGCTGCSMVCDHVDAARQHFEQKDIAFVSISRAPLEVFAPFKERMGWKFKWLSSAGNTFNYDYQASFKPEDYDKGPVLYNFKMQKLSSEEQPGLSVFYKDAEGNIYRTYSTYERGLDLLIGAYNYIDLTPKGRGESGPMDWVKFHDEYGVN